MSEKAQNPTLTSDGQAYFTFEWVVDGPDGSELGKVEVTVLAPNGDEARFRAEMLLASMTTELDLSEAKKVMDTFENELAKNPALRQKYDALFEEDNDA